MDLETIKKEMARGYSAKAQEYGIVRNRKFDAFLHEELEAFITSVRQIGDTVLDLGSGPGNESSRLLEAGLKPVCIDNAPGMVTECRNKGLQAHLMDFYDLAFPDASFAGVWMAFSLLHVPKKHAATVVEEARRTLVNNGIFYVSLFEGDGEGLRTEDLNKFGCERYFAYYRQDELEELLLPNFRIVRRSRLSISPRPTIAFQCVPIISGKH